MVSLVPRPTPSFAVQFTLTLTQNWKSNEKGNQPMTSVYYCQHKAKSKTG